MHFTRHFRNAFVELAKVVGSLEGNDTSEIESSDVEQNHIISSAPQSECEQHHTVKKEHFRALVPIEDSHSDAKRPLQSKDAHTEKVTRSKESVPGSNHGADLKAPNDDKTGELQLENTNSVVGKVFLEVNTYCVDQDLKQHNQNLRQESIRHLRWQDRASMRIKTMEDGIQVRKNETRFAKKRAYREKAAMSRQIRDLELRLTNSELEKVQMSEENTLTTEEHESDMQEVRNELEAQRETAKQAAAEAKIQFQEAETTHGMALIRANWRIDELRGTQHYTFTCGREANDLRKQLATMERAKADEVTAKEHEIRVLQTSIDGHNSEICRFRGEAIDARQAKEQVVAEKNRLDHAKVVTDRQVERLRVEIEKLTLEKRKADLRTSEAEGRAKGLQDQLAVTEKRAGNWEALYNKAVENARDKFLSAYAITTSQASEEDQQSATPASKEMESLLLAEKLRKEKSELEKRELEKKIGGLTVKVEDWAQAWERALEGKKTWEQELRRRCEEENREALIKARANEYTTRDLNAREQDVRRQCEAEKQTALAAERENCRIQMESQMCSVRVQCAAKLKSDTIRKQERIRRRAGTEPKKDLRIKKRQKKWVVRREVSNAVEVEKSLLQKKLQSQFQTQLSNYKTQFESEHSRSENQEMKERDDSPELKQAYDEKREAEKTLDVVREENKRLSRKVIAYESQQSTASQTKSEDEVTIMAEDHDRALQLLDECAVMGLDNRHRVLLSQLVEANKLEREVRSTVKERPVDLDDLDRKANQIFDNSDIFDSLDPSERPALHAQLKKAYKVIGKFITVVNKKRADAANRAMLKSTSGGKGKQKEKQGAVFGGPASSFTANSATSAAASHQANNLQTASGNTPTLASTQVPNVYPTTNPPQPPAADSQDGPEEMDSATAHALQGVDEMNDDEAPATRAARGVERSEGSKELEGIFGALRNNAASGSTQAPSRNPYQQPVQPQNPPSQSPLPGPFLQQQQQQQQQQSQTPQQPTGWTEVMTGWVQYLLQQGTDLTAIEAGMRSFFPAVNNMVGVSRYLENIKMEWEGRMLQD